MRHRYIHVMTSIIGLDKRGYPVNVLFLICSNICCGYSLEVPWQGTSNEYHNIRSAWRTKKNINTLLLQKAPYLELCRDQFNLLNADLFLQSKLQFPLLANPSELGKFSLIS